MRVLPHSPLSRARPGDRVMVREATIPARIVAGKIHAAALEHAMLAIFPDGWRQHRDGGGERGRRPTNPDHQWIGAMHMPRWASRATLIIETVRPERLQRITRDEAGAEGVISMLGGLLWRWPRPIPGTHFSPRAAFAHYWDRHHGQTGERWDDDPEIVVLGFHLESPLLRRHGN